MLLAHKRTVRSEINIKTKNRSNLETL
jgi:hypothetical protein